MDANCAWAGLQTRFFPRIVHLQKREWDGSTEDDNVMSTSPATTWACSRTAACRSPQAGRTYNLRRSWACRQCNGPQFTIYTVDSRHFPDYPEFGILYTYNTGAMIRVVDGTLAEIIRPGRIPWDGYPSWKPLYPDVPRFSQWSCGETLECFMSKAIMTIHEACPICHKSVYRWYWHPDAPPLHYDHTVPSPLQFW